ncbi:ASKHA domain-containing protein [Clostridium estertheticum]|uniref:ASKHA domain-containing protein n=1 Tax=Clostridium estertheticum TaxID=238834 RepID=UPI001CD06EF1|nr:ASKHA domain-containing protein [Clostridium estertheticum]MBZ9685952.1 ASKHA domain-containing protein [Clostridium estertheticum]
MGFKIDFDFNIEEDEIIRLLGYKGSEPDEGILDSIREEIEASKGYLNPQVWYKKIFIRNIEKDKVVLENDIVFEGEFIVKKLKGCSYIFAIVSTIGIEIDKIIKEAFDEDDYLKAMIVDNIGTTSVGYTNKVFWNNLVDGLKNTNVGITQRLSPGDTAWPVFEQKKIFDCLKEIGLGVELLQSCLMVPFKSTSTIFGFGEGIGITKLEHICSECSMKSCNYRMDNGIEVVVKTYNKQYIIKAFKGQNLLKALVENNIFIQNPCDGKGTCGKCKVLITKGIEKSCVSDDAHINITEHLNQLDLESGLRLACKFKIVKDIELSILSTDDSIDVLTKVQEIRININPYFQKNFINLAAPNINDQRDDLSRLKDGLNEIAGGSQFNDMRMEYKILSNLSQIIRKEGFGVTACTYENTLVSLESGDTSKNFYGIAMDIGTTTIATYLINMVNGETVDIISEVNNQRKYGADVISRINYTIENKEGTQVLKNSIINQINEMLEVICFKNSISPKFIYNMTIAGNTIMLQMLLGISCVNISMAPYISVFTDDMDFKGGDLHINIGGVVSLLPGISSYVGSDIIAGILASGMIESDKYSILLDLGTNGEIAFGNRQGIVACSTAAGPAFEGANIKYGIGGVKGAVSKIDFSKEKIYKTIGDELPIGICGSGVLDVVSELLKYEIIDETGRMVDAEEITDTKLRKRLVTIEGMKQFLIEEKGKNNFPIYFTQKDVREVQLAKAAISAGIKILISEKGINFSQIEKIYVAGGFGNFMNIDSTINIGMIPRELEGKVCSIGNGAGSGAKMYLLSKEQRENTVQIKKVTKYIELSNRPDFQEHFMDSIMF